MEKLVYYCDYALFRIYLKWSPMLQISNIQVYFKYVFLY